MGIAQGNVIHCTWRPSAKRLLRWSEDGTLGLYSGDDPLRERPADVLGRIRLPWPQRGFYPTDKIGAIKQQEPKALENVAYLAELEHRQYRDPVLCVCSTRAKTRHLATRVAQRFTPLEPLPECIRGIASLIEQRYAYLRPLGEALVRGVAYHNSSLPQDVREGIERAVESRDLRVVSATTTLAEGVDLPFRATILVDWLMFDRGRSRPMDRLLFKNIAGRCGRAGQFTEGDTIVFDNPVGDAMLTSPARRPQVQDGIFFSSSQPVLGSGMSSLEASPVISTIGSQLLAAIAENPEAEDLRSSFPSLSFAHHTEGARVAGERIAAAFREILDESEGDALAVAASPNPPDSIWAGSECRWGCLRLQQGGCG